MAEPKECELIDVFSKACFHMVSVHFLYLIKIQTASWFDGCPCTFHEFSQERSKAISCPVHTTLETWTLFAFVDIAIKNWKMMMLKTNLKKCVFMCVNFYLCKVNLLPVWSQLISLWMGLDLETVG